MLRNIFRAPGPNFSVVSRSCIRRNQGVLRNTKSIMSRSSQRFMVSDKTAGNGVLVNHEQGANLFFADIPGKGRAFLEYERENQLIKIMHTEVPPELGGRGLGKILAKEALDYIAKNDLRVEIHCEFVRDFVTKYEPKFIKYIRN